MTLKHRALPAERAGKLRELLRQEKGVRVIESHDGLSAIIGNTTSVEGKEFDALWVSSLTDSAAKGHPDTEVIDTSSRLSTIQEILNVTSKPIIVDGDTGGDPTQFEYFVSKLENMGVSAVVIEDKQYPKRNSLEADAVHTLEKPEDFAIKVNRAKSICLSDNFMIFTRIESFIAGRGLEDALHRAEVYLDSLADGIFIHSNAKNPEQIEAFLEGYKILCERKGIRKPLICVPTTYHEITDLELFSKKVDIVIYANHQLRAAYQAMKETCVSILTNNRSTETVPNIAPVKEIMAAVGFPEIKSKDVQYRKSSTPVVIPAAGAPSGFAGSDFNDLPIGGVPIGGASLLHRQLSALKGASFNNVTVISGHQKEKLPEAAYQEIYNEDFEKSKVPHSLLLAKEKLSNGFLMIFGDIIFDQQLLRNIPEGNESDVLLFVDSSINLYKRKKVKPTTDLVILKDHDMDILRRPTVKVESVEKIGTELPLDDATHEFIGIAKFSKKGAELFLEKATDKTLGFNEVIQMMIKEGASVEALEIHTGWCEVHNMEDIALINKALNTQTTLLV